jgi:hypothetical protein
MKASALPLEDPSPGQDRRRHERVALTLAGRFMLEDGSEFVCNTVDVSPFGVALQALMTGAAGERVVAYIQDLGRIEGLIVRRGHNFFALDIKAPSSKRDRLAKQIAWLVRRQAEGLREQRQSERVTPRDERMVVRTEDGKRFEAELIDISAVGAALNSGVVPPLGAEVTVDSIPARVARHFEGGFAVVFDKEASADPDADDQGFVGA